jgi:DNA-binding response OmpR family regulator
LNVLLIEPEKTLARRIKKNLEKDRFSVMCCAYSDEIVGAKANQLFDFVMISLDQQNNLGDTIIKRIRKSDQRCKIVAIGNESIFNVQDSLWLGVDDYVQKNRLDEISIRIQLLKRRIAPINTKLIFRHKGFTLHERDSILFFGNQPITLTNIERRILFELFRTGTTVKSQFLIDKIWGEYLFEGMDRLMKRVSVLRKKIKKISDYPLIETVKGVGYRLS